MENQIPLEKLIVSKDIIAQCKKEERVFSPFEQAVLIHNNPILTDDEKQSLYDFLKQTNPEMKENFANACIHVPFPYRKGDFVRRIGHKEIGIFANFCNEAEYRQFQNEQAECITEGFLDDSDMCQRVYYITYDSKRKMKTFLHRHQNILELERVELPENEKDRELLKAAQALLIGKGDLDTFLYYMMESK